MIIVNKAEKTTINIPKNSLGNISFKDYATQQWVKTNYYNKEEIDNIVENITIPYLVVNDDFTGYEAGDFESVRQAIINKKPYSIYIPFDLGGYLTPNAVDSFGGQITLTYVYHTNGKTMYYGRCYLHTDNVRNTIESVSYATSEQLTREGVYSLTLYYNEDLREYTFSGVSFSAIYSRIENKERQYAIYLPSSDNKYSIAAQEIVIDGDEIKCITIENNGTSQTITNWTIGVDEDGFEYYQKGTPSTINIATQEWIEQQGYLTSVPDEYITESELEEELKNIDYSLPTIKIIENKPIEGDIDGVINAVINKEDCNILWLSGNTFIKATGYYTSNSVTYIRAIFYYTSEDRAVRRVIDINKTAPHTITISALQYVSVPVDNLTSTSKVLPLSANQGRVLDEKITQIADLVNDFNTDISYLYETKQDTLVSGTNIKTINGNSILGSGDIIIEGGSSSNIVELTQAEYDALGDNVDVDTLYLISDATISANYKTINGESILGEGNIEISGGTTDLSDYYTKTECDGKFQLKGNYLTSIPSEYVTDSELTAKNYATKSEIPTIPTNVSSFTNDAGYITNTALDGYATETYVSDTYQVKGDYLTSVPDEYVTDTELTNKGYATTTYVDTQIGNINTILENIIG